VKNSQHLITSFFIFVLFFNFNRFAKAGEGAFYKPDNPCIHYTGRIDFNNTLKPRLCGAGSYFQFKLKGTFCDILVEDQNLYGNHNYLSLVIDDQYRGRIKVSKEKRQYQLADSLDDSVHTILVCKATEAQIGYIDFLGIKCEQLLPFENSRIRKIEFIGNSITCGMGSDLSGIPCDSGAWYDQHNAYLAYGPLIARELDADWLLSSVSGIGITRNWNSDGPTMPQVYQNINLDTVANNRWEAASYVPDLVSICLGTNDFSDGDGTYQRAPLDSARFVNDYIQFVKFIRNRYPEAQICCLSSPMHSGEKSRRLTNYLQKVMENWKKSGKDEKIHLFVFAASYNNGCSCHPDQNDQQKMAEELLPFYKKVMGW
jgi:lysophospholipase L1-like esterase